MRILNSIIIYKSIYTFFTRERKKLMNSKIFNLVMENLGEALNLPKYNEIKDSLTEQSTFEEMGITYGSDKFFHLKKFKYLPMIFDADINNGAGYVDPNKKQNKLSYCNTCQFLRPPRSFHCS